MFSNIKAIFLKFIRLGAEEDQVEHQHTSLKRTGDTGDFGYNSPHKRRCVETGFSSAGAIENDIYSYRVQSSNSYLNEMAESKRPGLSKMSKKKSYPCNSDIPQHKVSGTGRSSSQNLNHGKENTNVIEVSDDEENEDVQYVCSSSHKWATINPKLNRIHQSRQSSSSGIARYKTPDKDAKHGSQNSGSSGLLPRSPHWSHVVSYQPAHASTRIQKIKKPTVKHYSAQPSSVQRGIDETIRLDEKLQFAELVKQYQVPITGQIIRLASSSREKRPDPIVRNSRKEKPNTIECVDLTKAKRFDTATGVRHDQEVKPETLATKIANKGIGGMSHPKPKVSQSNSMEQVLKTSAYYQPMFLRDTTKKFEQKKLETQRDLQEPLARVERYGLQNEKDCMKQIEERVRRHMKITEAEVVLDDVPEEPRLVLPALTSRMQKAIDAALIAHPPSACLVEGFSLKITRRDMSTLADLNWLNDEVINFYMNLLIERGKLEKFLNVFAFNTFFYSKLLSGGHNVLKRWTRKIDIFSYDLIIIPVHLGVHWCMAAIDFRDTTVKYYDSMGNPNNKGLQALLKYLEDESLDKKKVAYDTTSWNKVNMKNIPQQMNGSDCGVFACMYAEFISREAKITFTQSHMPFFRRKMVYEILAKKLIDFEEL